MGEFTARPGASDTQRERRRGGEGQGGGEAWKGEADGGRRRLWRVKGCGRGRECLPGTPFRAACAETGLLGQVLSSLPTSRVFKPKLGAA